MAHKFDFIIVGGGTAGSLLVNRLSNASRRPAVLLVETGGDGLPMERRQPYQRYSNAFELPGLEYGFTTVPQSGLDGRQLSYQRGKGLGGSSMLNFMVYTRGPAADWNRWADLVGDQDWSWNKAKERFHQIETFHDNIDEKLREYVNPRKADHGYHGGLHVSVPEKELENEVKLTMDAGAELGWRINPDVNSGDIMGISIVPLTSGDGQRFSSERAFLQSRPQNLTIWIFSQVARVLFEDKIAVGIETVDGKKAYASKEIVVTAGSIDSPKLLLLSGIGPAKELQAHGIESIHDLPAVGKNAQDHALVFFNELMDRSFSAKFEFALDTAQQAAALDEWMANHSGLLSFHGSSNAILFQKDETIYDTDALRSLDQEKQRYLHRSDVPTFEIITSGPLIPPNYPMTPDHSYTSHVLVALNPQSRGSVKLDSKYPLDQPLVDLGYMTHPYDLLSMMAAVRAERELTTKIMSQHHVGSINMPKSESDEDILAFIRENASPLWHISSTARMGKAGDETAVVDSDMKVFGIQNLRVADLSVCPFNPNAHTQAAAYLIGQTAADKIIAEYGL